MPAGAEVRKFTLQSAIERETLKFYRDTLQLLNDRGLPYLVGGAYAYERYTGIARHTKDFDIFIRRTDFEQFRRVLTEAGLHVELTFPHWLGKAFKGDDFIDLIFSGGNGVATVDDGWFAHAVDETVFGVPVRLCAPEEIIWSKSYVMERERYDGADIAHILRATVERLDWDRLLRRFGDHWPLLYVNLVLFGFIYPDRRQLVPREVMEQLTKRVLDDTASAGPRGLCQGTLISRQQYLTDIDRWGCEDARLKPRGEMSRQDIDHWTAAIEEK